jgi:hypothetical protein
MIQWHEEVVLAVAQGSGTASDQMLHGRGLLAAQALHTRVNCARMFGGGCRDTCGAHRNERGRLFAKPKSAILPDAGQST